MKFWSKHTAAMRVIMTVIISLLGIAILFWAATLILGDTTQVYELGEYDEEKTYQDVVLTTYEEYTSLMKEYGLNIDLNEADFGSNHFIASFQEYDECSERKYKTVEEIKVGSSIDITYTIHNKCGWCQAKPVLYLIRIEPLNNPNVPIKYNYEYEQNLECGNI